MPKHGLTGYKERDWNKPAISLEQHMDRANMSVSIPTTPEIVNVAGSVTSYPMYLNDAKEDCTVAGMAHSFQSMTAFEGQPNGCQFEDSEIQAVFDIVSPDQDGATLGSVAQLMVTRGMTDTTGKVHKLAAWAEIDKYWRLETLKTILYLTGTVYAAYLLPDNALTAFGNGQPFTDTSQQPDPNNGHCMVIEYSAVGDPSVMNDETLITWATKVATSMAWMRAYLVEAVALFSEDYVSSLNGENPAGLDVQQMVQIAATLGA